MDKIDESLPDRIAETFAGKSLLLTGASGFVGKVLLQQVLRTCLGIRRIYVLLRPKHNLTAEERLQQIFNSPLFDVVKAEQGTKVIDKAIAIEYALDAPELGISATNRGTLIANTDMVIHCAAGLRMDECLKDAILMNVRATKLLLEMAKEMRHLVVFCHVSTAYCHLHESVIYEQTYNPPVDPEEMIRICETLSEPHLAPFTHKLLFNSPNTYVYTKCLAEAVVSAEMDHLPVIIVRPSLVIPAWSQPIPGWIDTINGSLGLQIVAGKGLLRSLYLDVNQYADLIPVDIAVNGFLAAIFDYVKPRGAAKPPRRIYHVTSSDRYKITWEEVISLGLKVITESVPLNSVIWYPGGRVRASMLEHNLCFMIQHIIPGGIVDFCLFVCGYRPRLLHIYARIRKGLEMLKFYNGKQWQFNNANSLAAIDELNLHERTKYNLSGEGFDDYYTYFEHCVYAARRYILKESDESLPRARRHMRIMYWVDKFVVWTLLCVLLVWLSSMIT